MVVVQNWLVVTIIFFFVSIDGVQSGQEESAVSLG
jgi:hypothetical protein